MNDFPELDSCQYQNIHFSIYEVQFCNVALCCMANGLTTSREGAKQAHEDRAGFREGGW